MGRFMKAAIGAAVIGAFAAIAPIGTAMAAETESSIARGGRLYDKWFAENKAAKPGDDHPAYPHKGGKYGKDASWRCKECHGWDYSGKDGAYAKGGHATGIVGINGSGRQGPEGDHRSPARQAARLHRGAAIGQGRQRPRAVRLQGPGRHDQVHRRATASRRVMAPRVKSTSTRCVPAAMVPTARRCQHAVARLGRRQHPRDVAQGDERPAGRGDAGIARARPADLGRHRRASADAAKVSARFRRAPDH